MCCTFVRNLHALQPNSSRYSIHHNSSHHFIHHDSSHHETKNCQWATSVQIPEFLNLSLISSFQDLIDQFSMFFPLCDPLAPLVPLDFPLDFHLFIACQCFCVHCSLVENVLHRT